MGNVEASSPAPQEDVRAEPRDAAIGSDASGPHPDGRPAQKPGPSPEGVEGSEEGEEERPGLIRDDGTINWDCPCLGGMAHGPCGDEFKAAFSCFHYSTAEQKGSDCLEPFMAMQSCFQKYPEIFGPKEGEDDDFDEKMLEAEKDSKDVEDNKDPKKGRLNENEKTSVQIK